jgi:uncharacterized protein YodC (DUF2158 family)
MDIELKLGDIVRLRTNDGPKMIINNIVCGGIIEVIYWVESESCLRYASVHSSAIKKINSSI